MKPRTLGQITEACSGRLENGDPGTLVTGISTDTRQLRPGDLFVALKGETHDGHQFVEAACQRGAVAVLVSQAVTVDCAVIRTDDTLLAYGRLGAMARKESDATFFAVTGSAGKTTTKDMLGSIVTLAGSALVAPGTENNEIGVPRLLLALEPTHQYCVLELAMRGPGEIGYLAGLCQPHIGVITNVGEAHVGRLGGREAIAKAKAELLAALPPDGHAVLNADDFFFGLFKEMAPCPVASFGFSDQPAEVSLHATAENLQAKGVDPASFRLRIGTERVAVRLRVPGRHNVANALAAAAAARAAGITMDTIAAGLEAFSGSEMRSQVLRAPGGYTVINDAYNASPSSVAEALGMLAGCPGRKVLVFGDMLELGAIAPEAHREIGRLAAASGVDWLIAVGEHAALAATEAEARGVQADAVADPQAALTLLEGALEPGDTVLVKASRRVGLETVAEALAKG